MNFSNLVHVTTSVPNSKERKFGSGYVIGKKLILTVLHIITHDPKAAVNDPGSVTGVVVSQFVLSDQHAQREEISVDCVAACDECDVALLMLPDGCRLSQGWKQPRFSTVDHESGNVDCYAVGFPEVVRRKTPRNFVLYGTFQAWNYVGDKHLSIAVHDSPVDSAERWSGMSGAGVLRTDSDELVGIVVNAPTEFMGKQIGFTPLGHFVRSLMRRSDGQSEHLPSRCRSLSPVRQGRRHRTLPRHVVRHLYTLDYAPQIQIASAELDRESWAATPIFMVVRGVREDRLPDIRHGIMEEVLRSILPGRPTGTDVVGPKDGREGCIRIEIPGSPTCALEDMAHVRTRLLRDLNVSDRKLEEDTFVGRVRELIRSGDCPRVFYSCLSSSVFNDRVRRDLDDWMHDWGQIGAGFGSCGFVYIFLVERDEGRESMPATLKSLRSWFSFATRWLDRAGVEDCVLAIKGVEGVTCIDLLDVEPVAWNPDIQDWIGGDPLEARLDCTREDFQELPHHAARALEVKRGSERFRMNEVYDRFVVYEPA